MKLREIAKKCLMRNKYSSQTYIKYLRNIGIKIGDDVIIYVPSKTWIDEQYPWMISIGDHVRITEGVKIITHDFSWSVLKKYPKMPGAILGASGKVIIGNNVFVGMNAIVCPNVRIGDNVIIGAGSVVTKDCMDNGVYVGSPAYKIMDIEEFYDKRHNLQLEEAKELAVAYFKRFGKRPTKEVFNEYFMLFESSSTYTTTRSFVEKMRLCSNEDDSIMFMKNHDALFNNFDEFMRYCFNE